MWGGKTNPNAAPFHLHSLFEYASSESKYDLIRAENEYWPFDFACMDNITRAVGKEDVKENQF